MVYSQKLIDDIKRFYPNSPDIIRLAETGSFALGIQLNIKSSGSIDLKTIMSATNLIDLKNKAWDIVQKRSLYDRWIFEYGAHKEKP